MSDFRDPLAYTRQLSSEVAREHHQQEKDRWQNAGRAPMRLRWPRQVWPVSIGTCSASNGVDPVFIPTGIDEGVLQPDAPQQNNGNPICSLRGKYCPSSTRCFREAFAAAKKHANGNTGIKVLVVGTLALNRPRLSPFLDKFGLHGEVEFLDQMPQAEIYKLLRKAIAGLLIPGINSAGGQMPPR